MLSILAALLLLSQTPTLPGGNLGPGGMYVPQQADDAGALMVHPIPTPVPGWGQWDGGVQRVHPADGGNTFSVCIQADCGSGVLETRALFNAQAINVGPGCTQAFTTLPSFVTFSSSHQATTIQHYVITDIAIASGSGAIIEGIGPYCDGGSWASTALYGPFLGPLVETLNTPIPSDPFTNLCFQAGTAGADARIGGYLTNYTPKMQ